MSEPNAVNRDLIESAPELLAAIKTARERIFSFRVAEAGRMGMVYDVALVQLMWPGGDPYLVDIDAAIAKAEGRTSPIR